MGLGAELSFSYFGQELEIMVSLSFMNAMWLSEYLKRRCCGGLSKMHVLSQMSSVCPKPEFHVVL